MKRAASVLFALSFALGIVFWQSTQAPKASANSVIQAVFVPMQFSVNVGSGVQKDTVITVAYNATDTSQWVALAPYRWALTTWAGDTTAVFDLLLWNQGASGDSMLVTVQTAPDPSGTITTQFSNYAIGTSPQRVRGIPRGVSNMPNYVRWLVKHADVSAQTTRFLTSTAAELYPAVQNGSTR